MQFKHLLVVVVLAALAIFPAACEPKGPMAQVETAEFDFGSVDQNDSVSHVFQLKNIGDQELEITRTRSTCGCTVAKPSKKKLQAGDVSEIKVTFSSGRRRGAQTKRVTVYTNDPNNDAIVLTLTGTVLERLSFEPARLRVKGVAVGEETDVETVVTNAGAAPVTVKEIRFSEKHAKTLSVAKTDDAAPLTPFTLAPGEKKTLRFALKLAEGQNFFHGKAEFVLDGVKAPAYYYISASMKGAIKTIKQPSGIGGKLKSGKQGADIVSGINKKLHQGVVKVKKNAADKAGE